jgi:hypothetical protein
MTEKQPQLANWEVAIIRAMLAAGNFKKQEIVAYFSRPDRSINQARVSEIEDGHGRYKNIPAASQAELEQFVQDWKQIRFPSAPTVAPSPTSAVVLAARFPLRPGEPARLAVSETDTVEAKEAFNWANRHDYCKTLAGMANNKGGYLLFGVKDGSFEVVGIAEDRMDRFDLKKANEYITRTFNQALVLEKGQFQIAAKVVGVLHVSPSANKPVICTLDASNLFSGDVFYRYPGETRRVQAPELEALLKQRDLSAENRLLHLVAKLADSGAQNAAVINLSTGEVTGERGRFFIDENLLDKIKFITEGRLDDNHGAPTLRVVGEVQPVGAPRVTIQQSVVGSISERYIQDAFLKQSCDYDPKVYIQAQTHLQPIWLPIYYFACEAKLDLAALKHVLETSETAYPSRVVRQIERIASGEAPAGLPGISSVRTELNAIRSSVPIDVPDASAAKRYMQAMRLVTMDDVSLERALSVLTDLRSRFGNNRELLYDFRYAIAAVDVRWFRPNLTSERG